MPVLTSVGTIPADGGADRRLSFRESRYGALSYLWRSSSLSRVRACRLTVQDVDAGVTLRRWANGTASWVGTQTCGSTWACPVCSEKIAAARQAEIAAALGVARARGLVVGFLTFTVRHRGDQKLKAVWDAVADAWRGATSGNARRWNADRDRFGLVGQLRLWEVTHGENGWHVHVHALVFLDPTGRDVSRRVPVQLEDADFIGPLVEHGQRRSPALAREQRMPRVPHVQGPDGRWTYRRQLGPVPQAVLVADKRQYTLSPAVVTERVPCAAALENAAADRAEGRAPGPGLYLRDLEALAASMFERWCGSLPKGMAPPAVCGNRSDECRSKGEHTHGYDARIVTDDSFIADYLAKNTYSIKSVAGAANEVTGSYAKSAKRGNRTPFGILADIVAGNPSPHDVADSALWSEWESVSRGRRQLRWSDGMRDLLELGEEVPDEDVDQADGGPDDVAVDFVTIPGATYRRLAFAATGGRLLLAGLELAEKWRDDLVVRLLEEHSPPGLMAQLGDQVRIVRS